MPIRNGQRGNAGRLERGLNRGSRSIGTCGSSASGGARGGTGSLGLAFGFSTSVIDRLLWKLPPEECRKRFHSKGDRTRDRFCSTECEGKFKANQAELKAKYSPNSDEQSKNNLAAFLEGR